MNVAPLLSSAHYLPYLFMEWDNQDAHCQDLATRLYSLGYSPWNW